MSAIAGWTDDRRNGDQAGPLADRIAARLSVRGRAGNGHWLTTDAVLIQVTDTHWIGSPEPAVLEENGKPLVAAVFDGRLNNSAGLAADLGIPGGLPPSELIAHAYLRWGRESVTRLEGTFAYALWDLRTETLLLARDRLGIKPLGYVHTARGPVFSSDVASLADHPWTTTELDGDGLSALITQIRPRGHGVLRGFREVIPGSTVEFGSGGTRIAQYWSLGASPHTTGLDETVKQVRVLLDEAVLSALGDAEPAILLSGGLDSSVLTGLTAQLTSQRPKSYTVVFDHTGAPVPDRPFAQEVVQFWDCDHQEISIQPVDLSDPATLVEIAAAKDYPTPFGDKNITPFLFGRRVADSSPVVLSGEGADAVFSGLGGALNSGRQLTSFPWIERSRALGLPYGIGAGLFDQDLLRDIDVSGHLDRMFTQARSEVEHLPGADESDRLAREIDYLTITRLLEQTVYHSERLSTAAGLQVQFPFADPRVVSAVYNLPARLKAFDGREKSLLRAVGRELVPESVLTRAKVPYPITYDTRYKAALLGRLRTLLDDRSAPVHALVDREAAERIVAEPRRLDRGGWLGRADVELVLQLDSWLRRLRVEVRV